jgi:hypothetical protein
MVDQVPRKRCSVRIADDTPEISQSQRCSWRRPIACPCTKAIFNSQFQIFTLGLYACIERLVLLLPIAGN